MLKRIRFFFSLNLIAGLLLSTLILSKPASIKACPPPPPKTLLSLYLNSDLIFVADFVSEKDGKILHDEEDYYQIQVRKDLRISSMLKGRHSRNFIFTNTDFRNKKNVEKTEEETDEEAEYEYTPYGYRGYSELTVGEKYLFFFKKDKETQQYELTDYTSGYKKLSDADLAIYKKRIDELKSITKNKDNQIAEITKWLIRCIEEPATRWDGVFELISSFEDLDYEDEEEEAEEKETLVLGENFYSDEGQIAKNLSDSQKEFISSILFSSIHHEMSKNNFDDFYYGLSNLVSRWDKMRLAVFAYSFFQTADKSDAKKIQNMMEYISNVVGDDELEEIASEYLLNDSSEKTVEIVEGTAEVDGESENKTEEFVEIVRQNEPSAETQVGEIEESESQEQGSTFLQKQEKILQKFTARYEYMLARGFQPDVKIDSTDN